MCHLMVSGQVGHVSVCHVLFPPPLRLFSSFSQFCQQTKPTFDFRRRAALAIADVYEIKRSIGLCETQSKVPNVRQVPSQGFGDTAQVGHDFCNNLDTVRVLAALVLDCVSENEGCLFASFETLFDPVIAKLLFFSALARNRTWVGGKRRMRTIRLSPSIVTSI